VVVVSDGTAVLGLGDIGPTASTPSNGRKSSLIQRIWRRGCNPHLFGYKRHRRNN